MQATTTALGFSAPQAHPRAGVVRVVRRLARRLLITVAGSLAVVAGVAMLVLPGPGLVTIALGLGLLGQEYTWAARLSADIRARVGRLAARAVAG
jgi:hypothetical protein